MTDEKSTQSKDVNSGGISALIVGLTLAVGILYASGWSLIWEQEMFFSEAFVINENSFAVRFNDLYYGASFTNRFFDSPAISWICLLIALGLTPGGFLFTSDDE